MEKQPLTGLFFCVGIIAHMATERQPLTGLSFAG